MAFRILTLDKISIFIHVTWWVASSGRILVLGKVGSSNKAMNHGYSLISGISHTYRNLGTIISSYCSEFEDLDGKGHGVKLETTNMTVR